MASPAPALILFFIGLFFAFPSRAQQAADPPKLSSVSGRVVHAITGEAIAKADVLLEVSKSDTHSGNYATSANDAGEFHFTGVRPGNYEVRALRRGFLPMAAGARRPESQGSVYRLQQPREVKDIVLRLTPGGVITGRVLDEGGEPLEHAEVALLREMFVHGQRQPASVNGFTTNDLGEFRWAGLPPGRYWLFAKGHDRWAPLGEREVFEPAYYPRARDPQAALPVELAAGGTERLSDFVLRRVASVRVRGRVEGASQRGARVDLLPSVAHEALYSHHYQASVDHDGRFEIQVPAGLYTVEASCCRGRDGQQFFRTVVDARSSINDLALPLRPLAKLLLRYSWAEKPKPEPEYMSVYLWRGGFQAKGRRATRTGLAEVGGASFSIGSPGDFGLEFPHVPPGWYVSSIRAGAKEVLDTTFAAGEGDVVLDVGFSPRAAQIRGVVRAPEGQTLPPGVTVVLAPEEESRWPLYQHVVAEDDGEFHFKSVRPGAYKLLAFEDLEEEAWFDAKILAAGAAQSVAVKVAEDETPSVSLALIPARP
jgi:hypothetical protein